MSKNTIVLGQREIDKVKSMPRKELNAECLHLMREQMELTQDLHDAKAEIQRLCRMLGYTDATDGERSRFGSIHVRLDEWDRLQRIAQAAQIIHSRFAKGCAGWEELYSNPPQEMADLYAALLGKGEAK